MSLSCHTSCNTGRAVCFAGGYTLIASWLREISSTLAKKIFFSWFPLQATDKSLAFIFHINHWCLSFKLQVSKINCRGFFSSKRSHSSLSRSNPVHHFNTEYTRIIRTFYNSRKLHEKDQQVLFPNYLKNDAYN